MDMTYLAVDKMRKDKGGCGGCVINIASGAGNFVDNFLFFSQQDLKIWNGTCCNSFESIGLKF